MSKETLEFKKAFEKFNEALAYIEKRSTDLEKDPERLAKIRANFKSKFEKPLDDAWSALGKEEQQRFATLYFVRREGACSEIDRMKKIAEFFEGHINRVIIDD